MYRCHIPLTVRRYSAVSGEWHGQVGASDSNRRASDTAAGCCHRANCYGGQPCSDRVNIRRIGWRTGRRSSPATPYCVSGNTDGVAARMAGRCMGIGKRNIGLGCAHWRLFSPDMGYSSDTLTATAAARTGGAAPDRHHQICSAAVRPDDGAQSASADPRRRVRQRNQANQAINAMTAAASAP